MDNKNNSQKPRKKKVTKEILRRRQLTALAVIAIVVLIFIILIANACTDKSGKENKKTTTTSTTTTTTTTTTTEIVTEPPTTTTTAPIVDPNLSAMVSIDPRELTLAVGETDMPYIFGYPDGSTEANEVWTSSDPNIATVDNMGRVTAVNAGECNIILNFDNNPAIEVQIKVTVTGAAETPEIPENPADVQSDVNAEENQDYQNIPENQEYQEYQPENNDNPENAGSLLQDTQGFQDTQNIVIPESADNQNQDGSQT